MMKTTLLRLSHPVILALALMLLIGAGFPTPTRAQDDADTVWYWATTPEGLVAYTVGGETKLVLPNSDLHDDIFLDYQLLSDGIAVITSTTAVYVITPQFDARSYVIKPYSIITGDGQLYSHPYLILWKSGIVQPGVVFNVETGEIQYLQRVDDLPRLLADGHTLRYVASDYLIDGTLVGKALLEYDLVSQTETNLYSFDPNKGFTPTYSSEDGLLWLFGYDPNWIENTFSRIDAVGDISPVLLNWLKQGEAVIENNMIVAFDKGCVRYCSIRVYPLNTYDGFRILLPNLITPPPQYLELFHDGSYVIEDYFGETLWGWLRTTNGNLFSLGIIQEEGAYAVFNRYGEEQHWALAIEDLFDSYILRLWDLERVEVVLEIPVEKSGDNTYSVSTNEDTILLRRNNKVWQIYDATEKTLVDISNYRDRFFQVLPDGQLLYEAPESGIYLFNSKTQSMTLLVSEGRAACCIRLDWEAEEYITDPQ